jgi:hypothetical protein
MYERTLSFVFPELDELRPVEQDLAFKFANRSRFQFIEIFGILFGLLIAGVLAEYGPSFSFVGSQVLASLLSAVLTALVICILVVPFLVRKTRRGIREYIQRE